MVDDQNNPTYKGIKTYSYPVVSYVGKDAKTKDIPYKELPCMFMENQNWFVKGGNFLLRKIGIKK